MSLWLVISFITGCTSLSRLQKYPSTPGLEAKPIEVEPPAETLRVGEKLSYTVRWVGIPVGTVTAWVQGKTSLEGHEVYHLIAEAKSNKFLSTFYKVEDHYESYWDVTGRFSLKFVKNVHQGKYRADEIMSYDPDEKKAVYSAPAKNESKNLSIPGPTQDPLSAVYYFRTFPYQPNETIQFPLNADEKNWEVHVKGLEQGVLEVRNLGVFEAFLVEPTAKRVDPLDEESQKKEMTKKPKARIWIWFSADERRLPLVIKATASIVGEVTAQLEKVDGL